MSDLNKQPLQDAQDNADKLNKSLDDLNKTLDDLNAKQLDMAVAFRQGTKAFKDNATSIQATGDAIKAINDHIDKNAAALNSANGSLTNNKTMLASLLDEYDNLTKSQKDNSSGAKSLNTQIGQLSATIADQEKKLAKSREVFDFHKATTDQLKSSFDKLKGSAATFAPALEDASKGFEAMKTGLSVVKIGFQSVGGAIKATGFGLLVTILQSVVSYFTETKEGSQKLQQILAAVSVVVNAVKDSFSNMGEKIVGAFTHPVDSLKALGKMIMDNFINRFKSVLVIWDGINNLDFKEVSNGILQAATGVNNLADKAVTAFNNVGKAAKATDNGVKKVHRTIAALSPVVKKMSDDSKKALVEIAKAAADADQEVIESKARMARTGMDELEKELDDTDKFYDGKLQAYAEYIKKYNAMKGPEKEANQKKYNSVTAAQGQLTTEKAASRLQVLDRFNQQYAEKIQQAQKELDAINQKNDQTETERKIAALQAQQDEIDRITVSSRKELDDQLEQLNKDLRAANIKQDTEEISRLNTAINNVTKLKKLDDQKQIDSTRKTADEITKIKNDAAQQQLLAKDQQQIDKDKNNPAALLADQIKLIDDRYAYEIKLAAGNSEKIKALNTQRENEITAISKQAEQQRINFTLQMAQQVSGAAFSIIKNSIKSQSDAKIKQLEDSKAAELNNTSLTAAQKQAIENKYKAKEAKEKARAFKEQQLASIGQAVINGALAITKVTAQSGVLAPLVIPGIIAETAIQIATIAAQKTPKFAQGGQFVSDGRGALLPGYSHTDNTNAYLRSGEAVVVSEAMRNPWARNLVSAINVAHGGRDFSLPNPGRGYAIGGIFTDGGNANRYYSQPVNDIKDMANTLAYQMINNFPPIYVDVKDVNNQQNILAQTINRVNL